MRLVRWSREAPGGRAADRSPDRTVLSVTSAVVGGTGGLHGTIVLGKERWKLRRRSEEDRLWASVLAEGLASLEPKLAAALHRRSDGGPERAEDEPVLAGAAADGRWNVVGEPLPQGEHP